MMSDYDYNGFKEKYFPQGCVGVPHIKAGYEWHKARQQLYHFLAPDLNVLGEIGVLIALGDFINCLDAAMDRIEREWKSKLEEFKL